MPKSFKSRAKSYLFRKIESPNKNIVIRFAGALLEWALRWSSDESKYSVNCLRARIRFNQFMRERLGAFLEEVDEGPVGSKEIIMQTAVLNKDEAALKTNSDFYFYSAYNQMYSWMNILERNGFNLRTVSSILELGCGSARLIRHLRCIDGIRLVGCDLRADHIEWCRKNIPGIEFYTNELSPPLQFAQDDSFDLVFASSVFTHIPLETQALWIQEMRRILRPGGFLLCDVLGRYHQQHMLSKNDLQDLKKKGALTLTASDSKASLSTQIIGSWDVFLTRGEVLNAFGKGFKVLDFMPAGLDLLILQKPSMNVAASGIERHPEQKAQLKAI
jgi:SAM-dependent methyltransferase